MRLARQSRNHRQITGKNFSSLSRRLGTSRTKISDARPATHIHRFSKIIGLRSNPQNCPPSTNSWMICRVELIDPAIPFGVSAWLARQMIPDPREPSDPYKIKRSATLSALPESITYLGAVFSEEATK
jgi:hypothetical protein